MRFKQAEQRRPQQFGDPVHEHAHALGQMAAMRIQQRLRHRPGGTAGQHFDEAACVEQRLLAGRRHLHEAEPGEAGRPANAPLTKSGDLLGRVNPVPRESDDFVKFSDRQRVYIAPALS